ncbi:hypothetical protein BMF89_20455 [Arthrobacter sp. SRS-W-1-2016]|uniref:hypothetical protein n=1 Tax=Arthrobacter sp. SRS-W-1-2016 TaxID=1930254 RepID=UPI0009913591|nr:hypothetical protein [Arthrobacter sp. SRS-W-1-2016]OOP59410.1 hypothetical protein BMF89_20455 [Arthrobacter sp. SRS-W-1-2016]
MSKPDLTNSINQNVPTRRRRPRYVLGTFWMILGIASLVAAFTATTTGHEHGFWAGPLMIAYSVYLYRGGRWGFFIF